MCLTHYSEFVNTVTNYFFGALDIVGDFCHTDKAGGQDVWEVGVDSRRDRVPRTRIRLPGNGYQGPLRSNFPKQLGLIKRIPALNIEQKMPVLRHRAHRHRSRLGRTQSALCEPTTCAETTGDTAWPTNRLSAASPQGMTLLRLDVRL